jgi:flagellar biosynthesis/type III secretory pathway protein FliH
MASELPATALGTDRAVDATAAAAVGGEDSAGESECKGAISEAEEQARAAGLALERARTRVVDLEAALEESLASGVHACHDLVRITEESVLSLALRLAERILNREVRMDPQITRAMVEDGLRRLADETVLEVACGADLFELLHAEAFESLRKQYPFVLASSLPAYGCEVRGAARAFAVGLDVRLETAQNALEEDR